MGNRYDREQDLQGRVSRAALIANHNDVQRLRTDVPLRLQYQILRDVLLLADKAMEVEGVPLEKRDRVVHWILVGEPALGWDSDPDAELADAMRAKVAERDAWVRHLEGLPFGGLSSLEPEA